MLSFVKWGMIIKMIGSIAIAPATAAVGGACPKQDIDLSSTSKTSSLYVLVSFSMPLASLQALGAALQPLQGKLVLRGLYENSFLKTQQKLKALGCEVLIDPMLFRALSVTHVPVFVVGYERDKRQGSWVAGHISLIAALEILAQKGHNEAQQFLDQLQRRL